MLIFERPSPGSVEGGGAERDEVVVVEEGGQRWMRGWTGCRS